MIACFRTWTVRAGMLGAMWLGVVLETQAQNPDLPPTFGQVRLQAGFRPDPFRRQLTAGGTIRTNLGGVSAHVASAPDFRVFYTGGHLPLTFRVQSAGDTTLLINLPDGRWIANDDGGPGRNPVITLQRPLSGRYDIFVGTFGRKAVPATLIVTELEGQGTSQPPSIPPVPPGLNPVPNPNLVPTFGSVRLRAGFLPDPFTRNVSAGGSLRTKLGGVQAFVAQAPDFRLFYTAGNLPLTIRAEGRGDTTLLINLPNGRWIADDDSGAGLNPSIRLRNPPSGRYDIYVGTFGPRGVPARLIITER